MRHLDYGTQLLPGKDGTVTVKEVKVAWVMFITNCKYVEICVNHRDRIEENATIVWMSLFIHFNIQ